MEGGQFLWQARAFRRRQARQSNPDILILNSYFYLFLVDLRARIHLKNLLIGEMETMLFYIKEMRYFLRHLMNFIISEGELFGSLMRKISLGFSLMNSTRGAENRLRNF